VINPNSSEQFPPPPRFADNSPAARMARLVKMRLRFLGVLLVVGVVLLALGHYTLGGILAGWAVVRGGTLAWRVRSRRARAREWDGR
jgi:hypothetical protein